MTKTWTLIGLIAVVVVAFGVYHMRVRGETPQVLTAEATRGSIVETVGATGTLEAVTTVQVGTQVSGTISALLADFNSIVRRGQVIARLDPSLFEAQVEQARSNLVRAEAELERLRVSAEDARVKLDRARSLSERQLIPVTELEAAEVNVRAVDAQVRSAEAQVTQARAALNQADVNLGHTIIAAPIDGIVISRNVDVGQTVAASMQAPTLFVLAADLSAMRVIASIDEADVGRIEPGQRVTFRVDAFPSEVFSGTVTQVRLEPVVQQNVVTYATVIDVANPRLSLKPGMTATITIEVARRDDVLLVPNAALRFEPTDELFAALGQVRPDAGVVGPWRAGDAPPAEDGMTAVGRPDPDGRRQLSERLAAMSPEEREALRERMSARSAGDESAGARRVLDAAAAGGGRAPDAPGAPGGRGDTTIRAGQVWVLDGGALRPVPVRLGLSDGRSTEVVAGGLEPGALVITGTTSVATAAGSGTVLQSPLTPGRRPVMVVR